MLRVFGLGDAIAGFGLGGSVESFRKELDGRLSAERGGLTDCC